MQQKDVVSWRPISCPLQNHQANSWVSLRVVFVTQCSFPLSNRSGSDQCSQAVRNNASQSLSSNSSRIVGTCNFPFRFKCCSKEAFPPTTALAKGSSGGCLHVDWGRKMTVIGLEMSRLLTISATALRRRCIVSPCKLASKLKWRRHP